MYRLEFYKQAARYYNKLDVKKQRRINTAIDEIIESPFEGPHIKKLKGRLEGKFRYNLGGLRVNLIKPDFLIPFPLSSSVIIKPIKGGHNV